MLRPAVHSRLAASGHRLARILMLLAGSLCSSFIAVAQDEERALAEVRARIETLEQRLAAQHVARDVEGQELRRLELAIAAATQELSRIRADLSAEQSRLVALAAETRQARSRLDSEKDAFARQIRLSYMMGETELFKLLLSQESPADVGRMVTYYDYLNRTRSERIQAVSNEVQTLSQLAQATRDSERKLERLESEQSIQVASLQSARDSRQALLVEIEESIDDAGSQIERLRLEEQRLADLLADLGDILAAFPVGAEKPFGNLKGQLAWPISGRVIGDYSRPREGGPLRWNGVVLATAAGTDVRAVYYGRVAYSDWLPGLGLLMILDHGDGYFSIYGYNQVLLKESGDWVEPGEILAQVGDTGGQAEPALYFELRETGAPIDPHRWMNGSP